MEGETAMRQPPGNRRRSLVLVATITAIAVLGAGAAYAASSFTDVPEDHLFWSDVEWMKDNGITRGCNPPANDRYCPDDNTARGEMAAFFKRFAE